jgi:hypothetical protein
MALRFRSVDDTGNADRISGARVQSTLPHASVAFRLDLRLGRGTSIVECAMRIGSPPVHRPSALAHTAQARPTRLIPDAEATSIAGRKLGQRASASSRTVIAPARHRKSEARGSSPCKALLDRPQKRARGFKGRQCRHRSQQSWRSSSGPLRYSHRRHAAGRRSHCLLHETASRALPLRRLGEAVNEH